MGSSGNLQERIKLHRSGRGASFTQKYNCHDLLYFEEYQENKEARARERQLRNWHKEWKWNLIKKVNPKLKELKLDGKRSESQGRGPETSSGFKIIPAIDIIDGKCVRLSKGDYATKKIYNENPLEVAKRFETHGITYLHLVDLDGAKSEHIVNYKILEQIAGKTGLKVDFGGGLKTDEDLRVAFECGANQITGGSIAVKNPAIFEGWIQKFGSEKIILGADAKDEKVAVSGWTEESKEELVPFIKKYQEKGIKYVICTDISKDGMLEGPAFDLYKKILEEAENADNPLKLIASGGISEFSELPKLAEIGCAGTIIGKAIYEGRISLKELEGFILDM